METVTDGNIVVPRLSWYSKFTEYLKNRNRISPGKVTLPDCDFFLVGPKRTLRILRPTLKSGGYYKNLNPNRPESINDHFSSRWSRRPYPSGNCKCSYRRFARLSTIEEQIIPNEIKRIRTSLCEVEKTDQNIQEIEQNVSQNLENIQFSSQDINNYPKNSEINEQIVKNKIVKDLEKYINDLLEEILNDTIKVLTEVETASQSKKKIKKEFQEKTEEKEIPFQDPTLNINFAFYDTKIAQVAQNSKETSRDVVKEENMGYVNPAFTESDCDPETLDFHHLQHCSKTEMILQNVNLVDSGINSVETFELQPEQEPSLEQSLMEIIDSKLGKGPLDKSLEDLNTEIAEYGDQVKDKQVFVINKTEEISTKKSTNSEKNDQKDESDCQEPIDLEDTDNLNCGFKKLRLEFQDTDGATCTKNVAAKMNKTVSALQEKLVTTLGSSKKNQGKQSKQCIELDGCRKMWSEIRKMPQISAGLPQQISKDFVILRKNRKPLIVFLHGFGSSAEVFENQLNYFSSLGYPCIAPDMLGHGMSSAPNCPKDYQFEELLKDLDAILIHYAFKPGEKCILVGHNYGCSFATALASKYDSNISQLVLISGGGPTPLAPPSSKGARHCFLRVLLAPFLMCGRHRDILYFARGRQHPYCGPEPVEQWPSHMKYVLNGMIWPNGNYVFHRKICTPTLLIYGLRDNKVSLMQECQMERTMIKAFLEAIPTAGHTPMTDCPEQLNHMIHCFIDLWKNKKQKLR